MADRKFTQITYGRDSGGIWTTGEPDGTIYRLFGDAGVVGWVPDKSGKAESIAAVSFREIWCVNKAHEIWHYKDENVMGDGKWTKMPTHSGQNDAATISVSMSDGSVWYADNVDGSLFRQAGQGWLKDPKGKASVVAGISQSDLWCINKDHEIWSMHGNTWKRVPTFSGKNDAATISVGSNDAQAVWYADTDGNTYSGNTTSVLAGTAWAKNPTGKAASIAAINQSSLWCVNKAGEVWRLAEQGQWDKIVEIGPEAGWTYTVKQGDHLYAIVRQQFHLTDATAIKNLVDQIVKANKITNADNIAAGTVLKL